MSVSRSSPKILTATSARTPVTISSTRSEMGCAITRFTPGNGCDGAGALARRSDPASIPSRSSAGARLDHHVALVVAGGIDGRFAAAQPGDDLLDARQLLEPAGCASISICDGLIERDIRNAVHVGRDGAFLQLGDEGRPERTGRARRTPTNSSRAATMAFFSLCIAHAQDAIVRALQHAHEATCRARCRPSAGTTKAPAKASAKAPARCRARSRWCRPAARTSCLPCPPASSAAGRRG